ncbi:MAG: MiaB/RimO family radical SAM methylthiotransferase [Flavobacteriia bacterium]|nr:MiaB/RimO family radical SAM methylthiotransferase [Flavobacteriia bacterium]
MQFQRKVAVYTLGCKLNFSESSTLARSFEEAGYARVDFEDAPDVFVINTCSVTENADKKCKQLVRKAKEINPSGYVAIVGCYAQLKPEEIAKIPGTFHPSFSAGDRTRSFLKIQDGCDYFCTFCTIPLARGKSRNASIAETLSQAKKLVDSPVREVVLTGVNIGDFGQGGNETFFQLIQALDTLEGIDRFRISSIEPNLLSNEIIDFCLKRSQRFMPHFHIPLQSGSDRILKLMRRKYDRTLFQNRVEHIKSVNPDCCIGVDVIVGFPGESDEDFRETMDFLQSLDVSYLHVFTYSERANTTAVKLGDPVPMHVRKDRSKQLHWLSDRKKQQFYHSQLGKHLTVLFEQEEDEGKMYGFTENYLKVERPFDASLVNQLVPVCVDQMTLDQTVKVTLDPL